jgi:anti-anti-sigma regulatory factor
MTIEFDYDPADQCLALRGELTIVHAADALAILRSHQGTALDLSGVSEMDGAGLQLLLAARRDAGWRLSAASDPVLGVLALVGLTHLLEAPA